MRTSTPIPSSADDSAALTSAKPPVLISGVTSEVANNTRIVIPISIQR
jgi:hypothetical protein